MKINFCKYLFVVAFFATVLSQEDAQGNIPENQGFFRKLLVHFIIWLYSPFDFEHGMILFISFYLLNYLYGRYYCTQKFDQLQEILSKIYNKHFAAIGFDKKFYVRDSVNIARVYASGRRNCRGMINHIELTPRQDLYFYFYQFIFPKDNLITFDVLLPEKMSQLVMCICPVKDTKKFHNDSDDLKDYTKIITDSKIPPKFSLLSDTSDILTTLFSPHIQSVLFKNFLRSIYISDQRMMKPTDRDNIGNQSLQVVFRVPYQLSELEPFIEGIFKLVDAIANYKPSKEQMDRLMAKRRVAQEKRLKVKQQERQEQLLEKKAEDQKLKEDEYYKLPPEQRRKWELKQEKERVKEQKKKLIKRSKLMH